MTTTQPSDLDVAGLALTMLDRLEGNPLRPELIDEAVHVLAEHRRRLTLAVVREYDQALTLPDVADEVAEREHDRPLRELSAETVAEVYISIYHDHLPRLVEAGLLEYDQERDLVSPGF